MYGIGLGGHLHMYGHIHCTHKVTLTRLHLQGHTVLTRAHCTDKVTLYSHGYSVHYNCTQGYTHKVTLYSQGHTYNITLYSQGHTVHYNCTQGYTYRVALYSQGYTVITWLLCTLTRLHSQGYTYKVTLYSQGYTVLTRLWSYTGMHYLYIYDIWQVCIVYILMTGAASPASRYNKHKKLACTFKIEHWEALEFWTGATGAVSLQNALDTGVGMLRSIPPYGHREMLLLFAALSTCDPGNIFDSIKEAKAAKIRWVCENACGSSKTACLSVAIIGGARVYLHRLCSSLCVCVCVCCVWARTTVVVISCTLIYNSNQQRVIWELAFDIKRCAILCAGCPWWEWRRRCMCVGA